MGEDYLAITYDNSNVPNFGSIEDALYSGGTLNLTLTGSTEYEAYKVWMDSGTKEAIKAVPAAPSSCGGTARDRISIRRPRSGMLSAPWWK